MNIKKLKRYGILGTSTVVFFATTSLMAAPPSEELIRLGPDKQQVVQPTVQKDTTNNPLEASTAPVVLPIQRQRDQVAHEPQQLEHTTSSEEFLSLPAENEDMKDAQQAIRLLEKLLTAK